MINRIKNFYYKQSLTTQISIIIVFVFTTFFVLQLVLNTMFFPSFYTDREIQSFDSSLNDYIDSLENANFYYDIIYDFSVNNNAKSVILNSDFMIVDSIPKQYTVQVRSDETLLLYDIVLNQKLNLILYDSLSGVVKPLDGDYYFFTSLVLNDAVLFTQVCENDCISLSGRVVSINKPNHLNYLFSQYQRVQIESNRLSDSFLANHVYNDGWRYRSQDGPIDLMVYVNRLNQNYVLTIVPIQNTDNIVATLSNYQNYVYLTALIVILLWSFRIGTVASKPIKKIERVAREISNLNFDIEALEYKSREASSLSKSINLISSNLKTALNNLNQKNQELMSLYENQSEQVNLKKQLVSSISHELKTPLMIIQVTIQGVLDGVVNEDSIAEEFNNILAEINKSSLMIQDLLQIYRLDSKDSQLDLEVINISKLVFSIPNDFSPLVKKYKFKLNFNIEDGLLIEADRKLIQRVLSNFMTNAIKYTKESESIELNVFQVKSKVHIEVINHGAELSEVHLENLWMPFYRVEHEGDQRMSSKGSGIGLYLVSEVLKAHNFEYGLVNVKNGVKAYIIAPLKTL